MMRSILVAIITGLVGFILGMKWSDKIHNGSTATAADDEFDRCCCEFCPGLSDLDD